MNPLSEFVRDNGPMLLAGSTLLLALGSVGLFLQKSPIQRQRLGELTLLGVLAWLVLASVPLPRYVTFENALAAVSDFVEQAASEDAEPYVSPISPTSAAALVQLDMHPVSQPEAKLLPMPALPVAGVAAPAIAEEIAEAVATLESAADAASTLPAANSPSDTSILPVQESPTVEQLDAEASPSLAILADLYLAGCGICALWLLLGHLVLARWTRGALPVEPWLRDLYTSLPLAAGQRRPRLIVTRRGRAMSWGVWRPTIALSADLCRRRNSEQVRHVLLHELGHAAQQDARGALLFNAGFVLLWFHPLYWWLRERVRFAGELVADDWAVASSTRETYALQLIMLVRGLGGQWEPLNTMSIFQSPTQFYRRMNMLLERETPLATGCPRWWRAVYVSLCVATVGLAAFTLGVSPADADGQTAASATAEEIEIDAEVETAIAEALESIEIDAAGEIDAELQAALDEIIAATKEIDELAKAVGSFELAAIDVKGAQLEFGLQKAEYDALGHRRAELEMQLAAIDQDMAAETAKAGVEISDEELIAKITSDPRMVEIKKAIERKTDRLSSLKSVIKNPDQDSEVVAVAGEIESLRAELGERKDELRTAIKKAAEAGPRQALGVLAAKRDEIKKQFARAAEEQEKKWDGLKRLSLAAADDEADPKQRREFEQQRQKLEDQRRALDEKIRAWEKRAKESAKSLSEVREERKSDKAKAPVKKASVEPKEVREVSAEAAARAKKVSEQAVARAKEATLKAAERAKKVGEKAAERAKKDAHEKAEEVRKGTASKKVAEERQIAARMDRDDKDSDDKPWRKVEAAKEKEKEKEDRNDDSSRGRDDRHVRELEQAKEQLGRKVRELEQAKRDLTRQVRDLEQAVKRLEKNAKDKDNDDDSDSTRKPATPRKPVPKGKADASPGGSGTIGAVGGLPSSTPTAPSTVPASPPVSSAPPGAVVPPVTPVAPASPETPGAPAPLAPASSTSPVTLDADPLPLGNPVNLAGENVPGLAPPPLSRLNPPIQLASSPPQPAKQQEQTPEPSAAPAPASQSKPFAGVPVSSTTPSTRTSAARARSAGDVVSLAKEFSQALADLEHKASQLARFDQMRKDGKEVGDPNYDNVKVQVRESERRVRLLREMAELELIKATAELDDMAKNPPANAPDKIAIEASKRLLNLILKEEVPGLASVAADSSATSSGATTSKQSSRASRPQSAKERRDDSGQDDSQIKVFKLQYSHASDAEVTVNRLFADVRTSKDDRTNSIVVMGPQETLKRIEALLERLDSERKQEKEKQ